MSQGRPWQDFIFHLLALGVLLSSLWNISGKLYRPTISDEEFLSHAPLVDLDTRLLDILSFGHRGLYDDFITIWMLQTLVDPRVAASDPQRIQTLILKILRHRPKVESFYLLSCFVQAFDLKRPELCEPILQIGTDVFPDRWRIPVTMGIIAAHHLHDPNLALLYYSIGAKRPESPEFIQKMTQRLQKEQKISPEDLETSFQEILKDNKDHLQKPSRLMESLKRHATPKSQ